MKCRCATAFEVRLCRADQYRDFKRMLDLGRHPAFIGRDTFAHAATNGGALLYFFRGAPAAVSLINPKLGILCALNVYPDHRSHGLGRAIMRFLIPNFARVIELRVPWFESLGYRRVGKLKKGQSLNTQIMVRSELLTLAGKLQTLMKITPDKARDSAMLATNENLASDPVSEVVRLDRQRRKNHRISRPDGVLAQAIGGPAL